MRKKWKNYREIGPDPKKEYSEGERKIILGNLKSDDSYKRKSKHEKALLKILKQQNKME